MIIGLRSPLMNRTSGNAIYFRISNVEAFLPNCGTGQPWTAACPPGGLNDGILQVDLENKGFRAITWDAFRQTYWIVAGPANGGRLENEPPGLKFSLFSWDGSNMTPLKVIDDLAPYAVRPEGIAIITVNGEQRVLFGEDRYRATSYGTRNAIHWPVSILGETYQTP